MKKIAVFLTVFLTVCLTIVVTNAFAQENALELELVHGDTLWTLAKKLYNNPYCYPELAKVNNINNQHWKITEGDFMIIPQILTDDKNRIYELNTAAVSRMEALGRNFADANGVGQVAQLREENKALRARLAKCQRGGNQDDRNRDNGMVTINDLNHSIQKLSVANEQLRSDNDRLKRENDDYRQEIVSLKGVVQELTVKVSTGKQEYDKLSNDFNLLNSRFENLFDELVEIKQRLSQSPSSEEGVQKKHEAATSSDGAADGRDLLTRKKTTSLSGLNEDGMNIPLIAIYERLLPGNISHRAWTIMSACNWMSLIMVFFAILIVAGLAFDTHEGRKKFFSKKNGIKTFLFWIGIYLCGAFCIAVSTV